MEEGRLMRKKNGSRQSNEIVPLILIIVALIIVAVTIIIVAVTTIIV